MYNFAAIIDIIHNMDWKCAYKYVLINVFNVSYPRYGARNKFGYYSWSIFALL